jgi:hypothetical protein
MYINMLSYVKRTFPTTKRRSVPAETVVASILALPLHHSKQQRPAAKTRRQAVVVIAADIDQVATTRDVNPRLLTIITSSTNLNNLSFFLAFQF